MSILVLKVIIMLTLIKFSISKSIKNTLLRWLENEAKIQKLIQIKQWNYYYKHHSIRGIFNFALKIFFFSNECCKL